MQFDELKYLMQYYLLKGYEISFEVEGGEILCRIQSGWLAVETKNNIWLSAFEKSVEALLKLGR